LNFNIYIKNISFVLLFIAIGFAPVIAEHAHNHAPGEEHADCPAYIYQLSNNAETAKTFSFNITVSLLTELLPQNDFLPVCNPHFILSNRAPPLNVNKFSL
jgi:hypothetical protein